MRWSFFILLTFLYSCAQLEERHDGPDRGPSSEAELLRYGDPDLVQSSVKEFPPEHGENFTRYFFFVELKKQTSEYVDRDPHEFEVKVGKKTIPAKVRRVLRGRYYVIFDTDKKDLKSHLDFYVAGMKLRESFRIGLRLASKSHSKLRLLKAQKYRAKFELSLRDDKGHWVEAPEPPEVIVREYDVRVSKIEPMGNGIWHITLEYPQGNQLFYLSVRSHGVHFKDLLRFHYVDKSHR